MPETKDTTQPPPKQPLQTVQPAAAPAVPPPPAPPPRPAANPIRTGPDTLRQEISRGTIPVNPQGVPSPYGKPPTRGFWESPQRIARYYNLIRSAPPTWKAPDWLNKDAINQAYDYMRFRNNNAPVNEWKWLPQDDPGTYFLKDLSAPPNEYLLPGEYGYKSPALPTGNVPTQAQIDAGKPPNWEDLPLYAQFLVSALAPEQGLEGRPEFSRLTAAMGQAALATPAFAAVGAAIGNAPGAGILGAVGFLGTTYQAYTGTEVPGLNEFLTMFDLPAIILEKGTGLKDLAEERSLAEVLKVLPNAFLASELKNETQFTDLVNYFGPTISKTIDWLYEKGLVGEPGGFVRKATEQETFQFAKGYALPQPLRGDVRGGAALWEATERLEAGEKWDDVYADYVDRFGFTGTLNDFVNQSLLDPTLLVPGFSGKTAQAVTGKIGKATGISAFTRASEAFRATTGNFFVDILPQPLQAIVSATTGLQASKGLMQGVAMYKDWIQTNYHPATMYDLPPDMRTQYYKLVDHGIDPKNIEVNQNKMIWKDRAGQMQEFVGSRQVLKDIPTVETISSFEKWFGGIDTEYGFKELRPNVEKKGIVGFATRFFSLDAASQAHLLNNLYHTVVSTLFDRAHGDPTAMGKMIRQLTGEDHVKAGDPGEMILKSPAARAIRDSVRAAAETAGFENMMTDWASIAGGTAPDGTHIQGKREILLKVATALGMTPADVLTKLEENPAVLMDQITKATGIGGSPEFIKQALDVFIGDDAMIWHEGQFQAQLVNAIADKMGTYMQKVYGLKPDHWVFRLAQVMKSIQSLVLLNFNPAYFFNNEINNMVTRAASGVWGYMTPKQIDTFYTRLGITPARLKVGASPADEGAAYSGNKIIADLKEAKDAIGKANRVVSSFTGKLGLFSRLSATFEKIEGANAFTIGTKQFLGRTWKRGKGFRKLHPAVERTLNQSFPGMAEMLYAGIEGGLNIQEINDAILGEYIKPTVRAAAQGAAATIFPDNPDLGMDILERTGLIDTLEQRMTNAKTPEDVDAVFRALHADLRSIINEKWQQDMIAATEHARTLVEAERQPAVTELLVEYERRTASLWLNQRKEWDDLYKHRDEYKGDQWSTQVEALFEQQNIEWTDHYKLQTRVYTGIAQALQVDAQANRDYLTGLTAIAATWTEFHATARQLRSQFFREAKRRAGESYDDYSIRSNRLWNTLQDKLDELYQKHSRIEDATQGRMDSYLALGFAQFTGWNPVRVQAWRSFIRALRTDMVIMQRDIRKRTRNMSSIEKDAEYATFNPRYNKLIANMKRAEILGAAWIRNQPLAGETLQSAIAQFKLIVEERAAEAGIEIPEPSVPPNPMEDLWRLEDERLWGPDAPGGLPVEPEPVAQQPQGIPFMITNAMRQELTQGGVTTEEIRNMTPAQAWERINQLRAARPAQPPPPERPPMARVSADWRAVGQAALAAGIVDKRFPNDISQPFLLNVVNAYLREQGQPEVERPNLYNVGPDVMMRAIQRHAGLHPPAETPRAAAVVKTTLDDIAALSDQTEREAYLRQIKHLTRREVREKMIAAFPDTPIERVDAAMFMADKRADEYMTRRGYVANDATRDAYYATRIFDIIRGTDDTRGLEQVGDIEYQAMVDQQFRSNLREWGLEYPSFLQLVHKPDLPPLVYEMVDKAFQQSQEGIDFEETLRAQQIARIDEQYIEKPMWGRQLRLEGLAKDLLEIGVENDIDINLLQSLWERISVGEWLWREPYVDTEFAEKGLQSIHQVLQRMPLETSNKLRYIAIETWNTMHNPYYQGAKGETILMGDGRAIIVAGKAGDFSTMMHELGHIWRRDLPDADMEVIAKLGGLKDAAELRALETKFNFGIEGEKYQEWRRLNRLTRDQRSVDQQSVFDLLSVDPMVIDMQRYVRAEELFTRGLERYLAEGDAPTPELRSIFKKFMDWFKDIYKELFKKNGRMSGFESGDLSVDIRAEIEGVNLRDIYDRMFSGEVHRTPTFQSLVTQRAEQIKNTGRNFKLSWTELSRRAKREVITDLLRPFASIAMAEHILPTLGSELFTLPDGMQVDAADLYDAIQAAKDDVTFNPFADRKINIIRGTRTEAHGIGNVLANYEFSFAVANAKDLIASHQWVGDKLDAREDFPQEYQPRDRNEQQYIGQVQKIARLLIPRDLLFDFQSIDRGAPIAGPDGVVESGNGRVLAILLAKQLYADRWNDYRTQLDTYATQYGIDPNSYADMETPVLIRVRDTVLTPGDRLDFVHDANTPIAQAMNEAETARADVRHITDDMLAGLIVGENETLDAALLSKRNSEFVKKYLSGIPEQVRGGLSSNGALTPAGLERLKNAMFVKVYPDQAGDTLFRIFKMYVENNIKSVQNGLFASLPQIGKVEAMIRNGDRDSKLSIAPDIAAAMERYGTLPSTGQSPAEYLASMGLFGEELTPVQKSIFQFVAFKATAKNIRLLLQAYANLVLNEPSPQQMTLGGIEVGEARKNELLLSAIRTIEPSLESEAAAALAQPAQPSMLTQSPLASTMVPAAQFVEGEAPAPIVIDPPTIENAPVVIAQVAEVLQAEAAKQKDEYLNDLRIVAEETGNKFKDDQDSLDHAVKGIDRMVEKISMGQFVTDALRATIIINTPSDSNKIMAALGEKGYEIFWNEHMLNKATGEKLPAALDIDDLFDTPGAGYKHIAIKVVRGPNDPVVKELLMLTPIMAKAKDLLGHDLYNVTRAIEKVRKEFTGVEPEVVTRVYNGLMSISNKLYSAAFRLDAAAASGGSAPITASANNISSSIGVPSLAKNAASSLRDLWNRLRAPISATDSISSWVGILPVVESAMAKFLSNNIISLSTEEVQYVDETITTPSLFPTETLTEQPTLLTPEQPTITPTEIPTGRPTAPPIFKAPPLEPPAPPSPLIQQNIDAWNEIPPEQQQELIAAAQSRYKQSDFKDVGQVLAIKYNSLPEGTLVTFFKGSRFEGQVGYISWDGSTSWPQSVRSLDGKFLSFSESGSVETIDPELSLYSPEQYAQAEQTREEKRELIRRTKINQEGIAKAKAATGTLPPPSPDIINNHAAGIQNLLDQGRPTPMDNIDLFKLEVTAADLPPGPNISGNNNPGQEMYPTPINPNFTGLWVKRLYKGLTKTFTDPEGKTQKHNIVANVYLKNKKVALMPEGADLGRLSPTEGVNGRLIGLDPIDPSKWVIENDGEITIFNPSDLTSDPKQVPDAPAPIDLFGEQEAEAPTTTPAENSKDINYGTRESDFILLLHQRLGDMATFFKKPGDFEEAAKAAGFDVENEIDLNLAYDLLEGAFNLRIRDTRARLDESGAPLITRIQRMDAMEQQLTTARRTIAKMKLQQFSTPLTISEAAAWAADVRDMDVVGEPTAGTGNLVDPLVNRPKILIRVNEIDPNRRKVLELIGHRNPTGMDLMTGEWINDRAPYANVIITNPPWGAYSTGKYGRPVNIPVQMNDWSQRFTHLMLHRLSNGGRLVGVMPTNWLYTVDRTTRVRSIHESAYLKFLKENYWVRAIIESPAKAYEKRATGVGSLLIVIDKMPPHPEVMIQAWGENAPKTWEEYADLVKRLHKDGTHARTEGSINDGQQPFARPDQSPTTGPDATGLVDPAATRGEPTGTPADIGKPTEPPRPRAGRGGTGRVPPTPTPRNAPGPEAGVPSLFDTSPAEEPIGPITPRTDTAPGVDIGVRPGGDSGQGQQPGGRNAIQATGTRGDINPPLVEGQPPAVPTRVERELPGYSEEFLQHIESAKSAVVNSRNFAIYVARSPRAELRPYRPHPAVIVEAKSLSGVNYPTLEPEYQPSAAVLRAHANRVLSTEGNLDPIWAAVQQNDKYNSGILIADDVGIGKSRTAAGFVIDRIERGKKRILVITKGSQNVDNLRDNEFPAVWNATANEYGFVSNPGKDYPAERITITGKAFPKVKKGLEALPVFKDKPVVYFVNENAFRDFGDAIVALNPDVIVVDEAHTFKSGESDTAAVWAKMHRQAIANGANFMYLTATPGTDISELRYLYGLKVWTMDGFNDWIGVITGQMSPERAAQVASEAAAVEKWNKTISDAANKNELQLEEVPDFDSNTPTLGYKIGNFVVHSTGHAEDYVVYDPNYSTTGSTMFESMAILVARKATELMTPGVPGWRAIDLAKDAIETEYPAPSISEQTKHETGFTSAEDFANGTTNGKKGWGKKSKTAFESTISPAHSEQIMRELKLGGYYMSRDISRAGVEFEVVEVKPSEDDFSVLDKRIDLYRRIYEAFHKFGKMNEGPKKAAALFGISSEVQSDVKRQLFEIRLPKVLELANKSIAAGEKVVISLVSVSGQDDEGGYMPTAISKINTNEVRKVGDGEYTDPTEIPEALIEVGEIRDQLSTFKDLPSPVDVLRAKYGDRIAFITGKVGDEARKKAVRDFQENKIDIIVISGAGKTGINLHDINGKRRVHLIVADYEWSPTNFKQELGRVDRTGQKTSPRVTVMHSGTAAERKFVATIANRMKGLGAVSKGGGETTGTGALIEMFELGSSLDKLALQRTWTKIGRHYRALFMDKKFHDPTTPGVPKAHIEATAEMIKKFLLGLQSVPRLAANDIFNTYMEEIKLLTSETITDVDIDSSEEMAAITGKTTAITGKLLRQTELAKNLRMFEVEQVKDGSRKRFAVIEGILTPHMARVKKIVAQWQPDNTWMKWTRVYDAGTQRHVSGLIIPPSDVGDIQRSYGQAKDSMHTPETAMIDLEAGDKIKVIGRNNAGWVLRMGKYGYRDGKIIIENAKMADREPLLNNGATYSAQINAFLVSPENLETFFKRFPIDNTPDPEKPQVREGRALYQPAQAEPEPTPPTPPRPPVNPLGNVQPGSIPSPEPSGAIAQEAITEYVNPLLNRMRENYKQNMTRKFRVDGLPEATKREIYSYLNQVDNDLSSTKLAAIRHGEHMRDFSILNYSRRYGFDSYLNLAFPYIFWYMRTMMNWGVRAFDRPAWFAMYARLRRKQEEQERKGMPTRLKGKVRIPLPWMPEWMGGGLYIDPYKQLFPPAQFGAPMDYMAQQQNQLQRKTEQVLRDLVEQDSITQKEMDEALATQEGDAWTRAFTQAQAETEIDDSPMGLAAMMMQPALWWTIPSKLASGKAEEIQPLPITKFGQSTRTALRDTSFEGLGNLVGAVLAGPEEAIREKAGLSKYGQWGDYYIDRMIANLAADGEITAQDAQRAMIERKGPAYDLALKQTEQEMMLRTPGTLPILALKEGAHPVEVAASVIASLFPGGLFPTGELKLRGLQSEYNAAWKRFDAGNEEAINQFFDKYPEYEARLALYDKPEDRLRQFLVSEIWDRYTKLDKTNRKRAAQLIGSEFEQAFLNKETRSYDTTDIKQLATWAQMLGTQIPEVPETAEVEKAGPPLDLYTGAEIKAVDDYYNTRDDLFPMATAWQSAYYSLPAGSARKQFLGQHPQLKKYWDWNSQYKADHPEIQPYLNEQAEQRMTEDINDLSAPLTRQLIGYYITGKELSGGAKSELNRIWIANGQKGKTLDDYMNMLIGSMFGQ